MKRSSVFLQAVILLIAAGALAVLLLEPQFEGRNAHATQFEIYFNDPFLAYAYFASIPFFLALWQAFKLAGYAGRDTMLSPAAINALRTIRYHAIAISCFVAAGEVYLFLPSDEDRAGGVVVGLFIMLASGIVATAAAMLERIVRNALESLAAVGLAPTASTN